MEIANALPAKGAETAKPINHGGTASAAGSVRTESAESAAKTAAMTTSDENKNMHGKDEQATVKQIQAAIEHVTRASKISRTKCEFYYHEATKRVSIKILDEETDEVLKEIPPEESLKMVEKMWELAGILVDEKM